MTLASDAPLPAQASSVEVDFSNPDTFLYSLANSDLVLRGQVLSRDCGPDRIEVGNEYLFLCNWFDTINLAQTWNQAIWCTQGNQFTRCGDYSVEYDARVALEEMFASVDLDQQYEASKLVVVTRIEAEPRIDALVRDVVADCRVERVLKGTPNPGDRLRFVTRGDGPGASATRRSRFTTGRYSIPAVGRMGTRFFMARAAIS